MKESLGTFVKFPNICLVSTPIAEFFRFRKSLPLGQKSLYTFLEVDTVANLTSFMFLLNIGDSKRSFLPERPILPLKESTITAYRNGTLTHYDWLYQWIDYPNGQCYCSVGILREGLL